MNLRALFMLLFAIWIICASALFVGAAILLSHALAPFLPPILRIGVLEESFSTFIKQLAVLIIAALLVLAGILYALLERIVIVPLRAIAHGFIYFSEHNEQEQLPKLFGTPKEIRSLAESFQEFTSAVRKTHDKDIEMSSVKSDFISTAAHQFRTPLTGIRWALEGLQKEDLTASQRMLVDNAVAKSHDLVDIVGTLLDISSIESGKYAYKFAPADMDQLVAEIARDFSVLAQERSVTLYYARNETSLPPVIMDRDRIKWVLNNVIENAIRYTPAQGTVRLTVQADAQYAYVHIKDSGIGIPAKDHGNIFQRFYRAENATQKETQGNGLGLYIARTIATDHHGDLDFEANADGVGTTFTLKLPFTQSVVAAGS